MSLKIWGPDGATSPSKSSSYADDLVGRFRSGYQAEGTGRSKKKTPVALSEWRVTTGDPDVAGAVHDLLGGEEPREWDASGEDVLEVFTSSSEVDVILEGKTPLRQAMILWGRNNNMIYKSDGETIDYPEERRGENDPQAGQTLAERKAAEKDGTGASPQVEIYFRLADNPDLGVFKFQSGSWSLVSDLAHDGTEDSITDILADGGKVAATLSLEPVEFTAKSGPRAGKTVSFTKPVLKVKGSVE